MSKKIDDLIKTKLDEMGDADPITLTNTILVHSMKKTGYDWVKQVSQPERVADIFAQAPKEVDMVGEFKLDEEEKSQATPPPQVEMNVNDPNVISTNPEFNMCPAFLNGICRVNGKPCSYSNSDYKDCGIYNLAKSGLPNLFEIPPGKENDMAYIFGIKDK